MNEQFSAGGIVIKKEDGKLKVLLIKDSYGHWTWPKGHMEEGETPEQTALREIAEETGLKNVKILNSLGEQKYSFNIDGEEIFKTVYVYLLECRGGEALKIQTSEIEKGEWFSVGEALDKIEYEGSRGLLDKGIRVFRGKV